MSMDTDPDRFDARLSHVEGTVNQMDNRLADMNDRLDRLDSRMEDRFDTLDGRMNNLDGKIDDLRTEFRRWFLVFFAAMTLVFTVVSVVVQLAL